MKKHLLPILALFFFTAACSTEDTGPGQSQLIKKEKVSGFVQKGPFVSGTSILMSELNPELVQTGKVFTSTISNDLGLFEVNNIELNSSFVEFTASGFYFNEVSGVISTAPITLSSLSDLTNKSSINVNVLTHLEKRRVENLIKEGKSFGEAKDQAKGEILSIFSILTETTSDFEDYDISKNNEEGGVLLAISIILQGNRSVGELTELLSKIQNDIASDGILNDGEILNSLRVSTLVLDQSGIRTKIESRYRGLSITTPVPDFEKHLAKFLSFRDYPLTINVVGEGKVNEEIVSNPAGKEYPYQTIVKLTPVPNEGWVFDRWEGDLSGNENPASISVNGEKNVTAFFKRRDYALNLTLEGEGTVAEEIVDNPAGREFPYQTQVKLTPIPAEGWVFDSWGGDLTGTESPQTITIDREKNVTAKFKRKDYPLNITIIGNGTVSEEVVSNPSGRSYPYQTVVRLIPIPENGSIFEGWEGDLNGTESPIEIILNRELNITAKFRTPVFKLAENGVTCVCENVKPGEKGMLNGVEYEAVDNELIRIRRDEGADMTKLCTSLVTDLSYLFLEKSFNQPIGNWDVSNVKTMFGMFRSSNFNQDISKWNVSRVENMNQMFLGSFFNQPLNAWNVGNVIIMDNMFFGSSFNQPIGKWDVSNVRSMVSMFRETSFNQDISPWNVSKVENMAQMFYQAKFNGNLNTWNVSSVFNMSLMFTGTEFNQALNNWNVENVLDMSEMFRESKFNQAIGNWNISKVTNLSGMFYQSQFNQEIKNWNTGNVSNLDRMFMNSSFDQDLSSWNVSKVTSMKELFYNSPFNKDISSWCVENIKSEPTNFSANSPLTEENKPKWGTCPD